MAINRSRWRHAIGTAIALSTLALAPVGMHRAVAQICTANLAATPVSCPPPPSQPGTRQIRRDRYGVPHITADTWYDANFQIGVEDARDRLVQLEFFRRASTGTLAEMFGKTQVPADMDTRVNLYSEEERQYFFTTLPCNLQLAIQAYADGINYYVGKIYRKPFTRVPHEFYNIGSLNQLSSPFGKPAGATYTLINVRGETVLKPGPWVPTDTVAVAEMLVASFGGGGGRQLRHVALRNYLKQFFTKHGDSTPADTATAVFDDVRWVYDTKSPTSMPVTGAVQSLITENGTSPLDPPPACPLGPPTVVSPNARASAPSSRRADADLPTSSVQEALDQISQMQERLRQRRHDFGVPTLKGSNGWVVAPGRSANGKALLWGGPQEGFDVPNIDNETYARTPDNVVGGMKIPGAPAVLIGETDKFAFTTTSGEMDNGTLYAETLDPSRAPADPQTADSNYYYLFNGEYRKMDRRVEVVHFAGENPGLAPAYGKVIRAPVLFNVFRVNDCDPQHFHGPVIAWDLNPSAPRAYTFKSAYWKNETSTLQGFAGFNTAKSFADFAAAVHQVVSLHNFFYADTLGNVAYWSAGSKVNFPQGYDNRFPADGSGSTEWLPNADGSMYTPFSKMIYAVNPQQGYVVNWNTKPADQPCVFEGNGHDEHWGQIYRSERIGFLLANSHNLNLEDIRLIAKDIGTIDDSEDTVSPNAPFFVPYIRQAYDNLTQADSPLVDPSTHPLLAQAVATLETWNDYLADTTKIYGANGHYDPAYSPFLGQPGQSILFQWWYIFRQNLFGGGFKTNEPFVGTVNFADHSIDGNDYVGETTINMAVHALEGADTGKPQLFQGDYFGGQRDQIFIQSLNEAIELLRGTAPLPHLSYGNCHGGSTDTPGFGTDDIRQWGWRERTNLDMDCHGSLTDPMFAAGTKATHFGKVATNNRSTYMQYLSLSQPPEGYNVIAPGQSNFIRHHHKKGGRVAGHYGDQVDLFRNFQYKPMALP
ncbi:MAG: penicillin acylase family protein [Deltaproteobacteria bacterium]|nr:penicillin acylase family protein [Deltaproteobacteria bacterium]